MNATADDWESIDQIQPEVDRFWKPTPRVVIAAEIVRLVQIGLFADGQHSDRGEDELSAEAILANPIQFWFKMTPMGRNVWEAEASKISPEEEGV